MFEMGEKTRKRALKNLMIYIENTQKTVSDKNVQIGDLIQQGQQ